MNEARLNITVSILFLITLVIVMSIIQDDGIIENTLMCDGNVVHRYTAHDEFIQDYDTNRVYEYLECK
jgi:hypothetical protein